MPVETIEPGAWQYEPSSVVDPVGRVVHYEGRILRGIRAEYVDASLEVLAAAERGDWFKRGLVPTWRTPLQLPGFPLVLEHQRIPFVTLRAEWSRAGLKRAALCLLDVAIAAVEMGFGLKDAHTWNVLFDGPRPWVTDFGSIARVKDVDGNTWLREFTKYALVPLLLFERGDVVLARALLREQVVGVGHWFIDHNVVALLPDVSLPKATDTKGLASTLHMLRERVERITFAATRGEWTDYPQPQYDEAEEPRLRVKDQVIQRVLDGIQFTSAIDLGANRGLHASMCERRGATVLAADIDETCLSDVYERAATQGQNILPVYLDVVWPLGSGGAFGTIPSALERLRCDLVLALALMHHVCLRQRFTPEAFVACVAAFSRKAAIIEFIPDTDWHVAQWRLPPLAGYSIDAVAAAASHYFEQVVVVDSDPSPRQFLICQGRRSVA